MALPIWKRILKWLAWSVGGMLTLVVVAYLALLVINWHDVPPSEAARRLQALHRNRPAVPDGDNGYVYVMGFSVEPGADPQERGLRRVAWVRNLSPQIRVAAGDDPAPGDSTYGSNRLPAAKQISDACRSGSAQCALALESSEAALREWLASEKWLLDRYVTLLHRPGWVEAVPVNIRTPLPAYAPVLDGQKLLFAKAYLLARDNDAAGVQGLLGDDVRFWRHVLASSDVLLTKMIAVAALHRHFAIGNIVLRRLPPGVESAGMPQEWTTPMTDDERSLLRTFAGEWVFGDALLQNALPSGAWRDFQEFNSDERVADKVVGRLSIPFFQPQDTSNRRAEMFIQAVEVMNVPLENLPRALEQAKAIFEAPAGANGHFTRLYNPVGAMLLPATSGGFAGYGGRVADVEGSRRAAVLTARLRERKVDVQQISAELVSSEIRAPYDGKPFEWDVAEQAVVFVGLEKGERGRHSFKY